MQPLTLFLQVVLLCICYTWAQQFNFNNNAPIPPRFLVPGAFSINQPQPQPKRLNPENENTVQRLRRPIGRARSGAPPPASLVPLEPELLSAPSSPRNLPPFESSSIQPRPVIEDEEENTEEDAPQVSTIAAPINTAPPKTIRPSLPFRPTKPQFFSNTNIIDEEENDFQTTRAQPPPPVQTTIQEPQQFQRKQATRVQNFRQPPPPPPQQEFVENKISRQFEKPIKSKFEKSEIPEKRVKKPVAQVLRRYREDNPDGSITWGFENDDGSYKEETIGNDCVTKGKYGYIDPDGVRREYTYSSGLPCDKNKLEQSEEGNSPAGYIDYSSNRVVLANGDSVDLNNMVKNRARKQPTQKYSRS